MARSKSGSSASEMLNGLKSRLGFSHNDEEDEEFSRYDADFDDYDDFDEDGFEDGYTDGYEETDEFIEEETSVGGFKPISASGRKNRFGHPESTPNLVTAEDVREHTRSMIGSRGSYEDAHRSTSSRVREREGSRNSSGSNGKRRESSNRSEGLNSLFESTAMPSAPSIPDLRGLTVIKPVSYNDVEGVARALKAGDAVVLSMRNTPEDLYKRILDFSFGVASALDANVDCPAAKVYAIIRGAALSEEEKSRLRTQGVL